MKHEWVSAFEQVKLRVEDFAEKIQPLYARNDWGLYNHHLNKLEIPTVDFLIKLIHENIDCLVESAAAEDFNGFGEVASGCISVRATNYSPVGPQVCIELIAEEVWSYGAEEVDPTTLLN